MNRAQAEATIQSMAAYDARWPRVLDDALRGAVRALAKDSAAFAISEWLRNSTSGSCRRTRDIGEPMPVDVVAAIRLLGEDEAAKLYDAARRASCAPRSIGGGS